MSAVSAVTPASTIVEAPPSAVTAVSPPEKARPAKRARVAVACQRCKSRKQKCDGRQPCSNCRDFQANCQYISSNPKSMILHREQQSVRAVEERVAELESILLSGGINALKDRRQSLNAGLEGVTYQSDLRPDSPRDARPKAISSPRTRMERMAEPGNSPHAALTTVVEILRDLSLEASGGYIGASSQITMGRMISSIVQAKSCASEASKSEDEEHLSPKSASNPPPSLDGGIELSQMPADIAEKLFRAYIRHISTRWPLLQTPFIGRLHNERLSVEDTFLVTVLHLVYAIGGRFLETTGETGNFYPEQHYEQALRHLDEICRYHDMRTVQVLLLFSIYSLRSPRGPGAWTYVGLAMRNCIEMGLHRKTGKKRSILENEMRKRIFWVCYCLDRQISIILGRPFAISDRDIDVELPLDVDEALEDTVVLESLQESARTPPFGSKPRDKSTSMTGFIYICRLRMIESRIQQSIYRVDHSSPATKDDVEKFIQQLDEWRESMPIDARNGEVPRLETMIMDGYDHYMVYYYKCMRFLLHPVILSGDLADTRFLKTCAAACGGVCQTYKKLHQIVPVGFSVMALYSVFLAGLTLLYCTWASPKEVFSISTSNDMNACSIVLYIITERWTGAKKYRDVFETIKQAVLDSIEEGEYEPRRVIKNLRPGLEAAFSTLDPTEEGQGEFSALVTDMAGGPSIVVADGTTPGGGPISGGEYDGHGGGFTFSMPLDGMPFDFHDPDTFGPVDMALGTPSNDWMARSGLEGYGDHLST